MTGAPEGKQGGQRLFVRITRDNLPQVKDRYPFLYLEYGRLEVDDSSVKWLDCDGQVIRLPIATLQCLLLGPGTSITHEAVKVTAQANCSLCWVGEDGLLFYASGQTPTANSRNLQRQIKLAGQAKSSLEVARRLFARRFPDVPVSKKSLKELMGMEGHRVKEVYAQMAERHQVQWKGRRFTPGDFEKSDLCNQILTAANAALYGIIASAVHALGFSPHVGFIHSGSPLPFVYDLADLYKEELCIDLAFGLTLQMAGQYNRHLMSDAFRQRVLNLRLLERIGTDIGEILDLP